MTPEQIVAAKQIVDQAASASDRWLFLASLILIIGGGVFIIKWLVRQLESQRAAHAEESKEHAKQNERVTVVLFEATAVMKDVRRVLEKHMEKDGVSQT